MKSTVVDESLSSTTTKVLFQRRVYLLPKRIVVFNVKNQDALLDIVLTLGAMNVTNMVISSWTAHTEYLLLELQ